MHITIVGAGKSGVEAAKLAVRQGHDVFVTEQRRKEETALAGELTTLGIKAEFGGSTDRALEADLIIVSPGVPPSNIVRTKAAERDIDIVGELEYASRYLRSPIVAITGTNGKTTTTSLTAHILRQSGRLVVEGGNIGTPLSAFVGNISDDTIIVCETSSYQLDTITSFAPRVAVILNITADHLTYHGTFEHYVQAKWKILAHQRRNDIVILNADDPHAAAAASVANSRVRYFSVRTEVEGAFVRGDNIVLTADQHKEEILMPVRRLGLRGVHNTYNSMAAALSARALEVRNEDIRDSLQSFSGVEHRLENVRTVRSVSFVNDSKATNVNAAWYALSSFDRPIVWIAGGRGDNNDYSALDELVATNVRAIVCIGEEADAIFSHWCTTKRCVKATSMNEAVRLSADLADDGDVVLFSPACKSFDMFSNYEERGRAFKDVVESLGV